MTGRKRAIFVAAGCLAVLVGLGVALVVAFPAERVGRMAAERASAALDRDVSVGSISFKLFPAPAVALEGVTVARWKNSEPRDPAIEADSLASLPLAAIARVDVRPRLLPLIRGEMVVNEIVIDRPTLTILVDSAAESLSDVVQEDTTAGFWDDATFQIKRIQVRSGTIEYRDVATGGTARIDDIDQVMRLDGELSNGQLARLGLTGNVTAGSVDADLPAKIAVPIHDLRLGIAYDAVLDLSAKAATINDLAVTVQETKLDGSGTITAWSDPDARRLSLRFETTDADIADLLASLPSNLRSWPANAAAGEEWTADAGHASVRVAVDGRLGNGELPVVDGTLSLDSVALSRGRDPVITGLAGQVKFSLDSASTEGITAQLLGEPLRLAFSLDDMAAPSVTATLATRVDLAKAQALGLFPEGWSASGSPAIDLAIDGPVMDPAKVGITGTISLAGVTVGEPDWAAPVAVSAGGLEFAGSQLLGRGLAIVYGKSDASVDFAVTNWLPFAFGKADPAPDIAFDSRSKLLDLDQLFPPDPDEPTYSQLFLARLANTQINGMPAAAAAEAAGLSLPEIPKIQMEGRIRADRIVQRGGTYDNVDARVAAREGQLELRSADFGMFGGQVNVAARLGSSDSTASPGTPLNVDFSIQDIQADPFLQRFTAFRDHLGGSLLLNGTVAMLLDEHLLPVTASLSGGGDVGVADGRLINWPMVKTLGDQLGIARFDTIAFKNWDGRFDMIGSKIVLGETTMQSGGLEVDASGSFDVSGQLDLAGTAYLGQALTSRVSGTAATLLAAASDSGRVPVGVRISGSARKPSVRLDMSEAGRLLATRAKEEAAARARELVTGAAQKVVGAERIPQVSSPAEALDSARQRVGDAVSNAVVGRLRGLLGPRAAQPDTTAADTAAAPDTSGAAAGGG